MNIVHVRNDMGHLCWEPIDVPQSVKDQIDQDVYTYYRSHGHCKLRHYRLKPHVSTSRQIGSWTIDYSALEQGNRLTYQEVPNGPKLLVLDNLLSVHECTDLIAKANSITTDSLGNKSWHAPGTGGRYSRVIMINPDLAKDLWQRIRSILPPVLNGVKLLYLNDHFRFSRYSRGGVFHTHCDGKNYDSSHPELCDGYSTESVLTLNIFLNSEGESLTGGSTTFFMECGGELHHRTTVKAQVGRAALFWAEQYHRGDEVTDGRKYLLRTDVMGTRRLT